MKQLYNKKGFTLIELLAAITILGILSVVTIMSISRIIQKGKDTQKAEQEKTVEMATESYMQSHKSEMPKAIGETTTIPITVLRNNNYLKEDIKADGKSCMEKSYTTVYKQSKDQYIYTAHIYCGDEEVPTEEEAPIPTIQILFTDASGEENEYVFENVSEAKIIINFTGGKDKDDTPIAIDGYHYSISTSNVNSNEVKEVFNSGTLSGNGKTEIKIEKALKDYIDVTQASYITVKATVRNVKGGVLDEKISSIDSSGSAKYQDTTPPYCVDISNQAKNENDWVNVYSNTKYRKLTATCSDGDGSGCIRDKFTRTWPNNDQKSAEYAYIQVKDNAGNTNVANSYVTTDPCELVFTNDTCRVRINVDLERPKIELVGYKRNSSGEIDGNSILNGATTQSTETSTLQYTKYKNLINNWMNKDNYPYGVIYKITFTDDLHLYSWKWETNKAGINNRGSGSYSTYKATNPDGIAETFFTAPDLSTTNCGKRKETVYISLVGEGMRAGKLTVKDKAGNETIFFIQADIDRTAPTTPNTYSYRWHNNNTRPTSYAGLTAYTPGTWLSGKVFTTASDSTDDISKGIYYRYTTTGRTTNENDVQGNYRNIEAEGYSYIQYRACDAAGNCGTYNDNITIMLDRTGPSCTPTKTNTGGFDGVSGTISCSDTYSGCRNNNVSSFTNQKSSTSFTVYDILGNPGSCSLTVSPVTYYRTRTRSCNTWARCASAGCASYSGWSGWNCTNTYTSAPYGECYDGLADCAGAESGFYAYNCRTRSCSYYNRSSDCGCETYSDWSNWTGYDYTSCNGGTYRQCNSKLRYF